MYRHFTHFALYNSNSTPEGSLQFLPIAVYLLIFLLLKVVGIAYTESGHWSI